MIVYIYSDIIGFYITNTFVRINLIILSTYKKFQLEHCDQHVGIFNHIINELYNITYNSIIVTKM